MKRMKSYLNALAYEQQRIWYWWTVCRVALTQAIIATANTPAGFEKQYYQEKVKGQPKKRLKLFKEIKMRYIYGAALVFMTVYLGFWLTLFLLPFATIFILCLKFLIKELKNV